MAATTPRCFFLLIFCIISVNSFRIIDLSWDYTNKTLFWPDGEPFHYTKKTGNTDLGYWYAANDFCTAEHSGTHFDAPLHFNQNGWDVAQVPVEKLLANGVILDLSNIQPVRDLTKQDLEDYVKKQGNFENNTVLLIKFGWSKFWTDRNTYFGFDNLNRMNFPGISPQAADWIAQNKRIVGVGVDTASVDCGRSTEFETHRILSKNQIYALENVKLQDNLPGKLHLGIFIGDGEKFVLVVSPMKLKDGSGAPARIFAVFGLGNRLD